MSLNDEDALEAALSLLAKPLPARVHKQVIKTIAVLMEPELPPYSAMARDLWVDFLEILPEEEAAKVLKKIQRGVKENS